MKILFKSNRFRRLVGPMTTKIRNSSWLYSVTKRGKRLVKNLPPSWEIGSEEVDPRYQVDFRSMLPVGFNGSIGVIVSEQSELRPHFTRALEILGLSGRMLDPYRDDFHDSILAGPERHFLCRPGHYTNQERQMFWEKTLPLYDWSEAKVSPARHAFNIYEAKRELSYFLKINRIPHAETHVFYHLEEALSFARECPLPQVFKTNTGSSATGVEILRDRSTLISFIRDVFNKYYVKKSLSDYRDIDYGHVTLQRFIDPVREFRVIKVGDSWFGHEKLPDPGTDYRVGRINNWESPSFNLLDFCADLAHRFNFNTMSFDIFQNSDGQFMVNELQTWFGSYNNSQMYIDGVPGRYIRRDGKWIFEPGFFNQCRSLPLIIASSIQHMVGNS